MKNITLIIFLLFAVNLSGQICTGIVDPNTLSKDDTDCSTYIDTYNNITYTFSAGTTWVAASSVSFNPTFTSDQIIDLGIYNLTFDASSAPLDEIAIPILSPDGLTQGFNISDAAGPMSFIMNTYSSTESKPIISHNRVDMVTVGGIEDSTTVKGDKVFIDATNIVNDNAATHLATIDPVTGEVGTREASSIISESRAFMSVVGGSTSFVSGTPERLDGDTPGTTTDVSSTSDWTVSGSVMTYTGTETRDFEVHAEISTSLATTGDATYYISKNSTIITPGTRRDHGNDDVGAASITWIVSMATSDTIDVRVDAPTDETCNVQNYSVKVKEW